MEDPEEALRQITGPGGPFEIAVEKIRGVPTRAYQRGPRTLVEVLAEARPGDDETIYLIYSDDRFTHAETGYLAPSWPVTQKLVPCMWIACGQLMLKLKMRIRTRSPSLHTSGVV